MPVLASTLTGGWWCTLQARLQSEAEAVAASEERLGQVMAAMQRCQAAAADLDELADAYSDLQVRCPEARLEK